MMMTLHDAVELLQGAGMAARLVGAGDVPLSRVHTDTRTLEAGDLFVALKGEHFDANDFLDRAGSAGAAAVVATHGIEASGLPGIQVEDTRLALAALARGWRAGFALPVIAVTGSNGKTTTTQMIAAVLHAWQGDAALATRGNFNNEIGVPLTVLRLRDTHRVAVIELGMSHPGEIRGLAAVAQPTVALVNNAQREHQEFMATVEAVARENGHVLEALPSDGTAVFPADDAYTPLWRDMAGDRHVLTFAADPAAAADCVAQAEWMGAFWQARVATPEGSFECELHVAGRHNVKNALAATACALAAGVPLAAIAAGLSGFEPVTGRSRALSVTIGGRQITLVDDSYNANPDSVRAAIDVLAELPAPGLLVLGDMGEVGNQGAAFHREVGAYARERGIAGLWTAGALAADAAAAFGAGARHFNDVDMLADEAFVQAPAFASVVVKGSRFMHMERVVRKLSAQAHPVGETHAA